MQRNELQKHTVSSKQVNRQRIITSANGEKRENVLGYKDAILHTFNATVQILATPGLKHIQQQVSKKQQNVTQIPSVDSVCLNISTFTQQPEEITENS